jgi:chromosomal replication initiator protein
VALARHVAIYLARLLTDHSLSEIGAHLGGRRHATASSAFRRIQGAIEVDGDLKGEIDRIIARLRR